MKIEVDIETLEDVLDIAREAAHTDSDWNTIWLLSCLVDKAKESSRPSNLDNLFRGPGYFSGDMVDNKKK
mgnify:CR=1 FL=1